MYCHKSDHCQFGKCKCSNGYKKRADQCYKILRYGEKCGPGYGICPGNFALCSFKTNRCDCLTDAKPVRNSIHCIAVNETLPNESCTKFCTDVRSYCKNGVCSCFDQYAPSSDGKRCEKSKYHRKCVGDSHCLRNMVCLFDECHCKNQTIFLRSIGKCVHRKAKLSAVNGSCTVHTERRDSRVCVKGSECSICPHKNFGICIAKTVLEVNDSNYKSWAFKNLPHWPLILFFLSLLNLV
ncbi:DgyrCDS3259 [Dimorphilus gyrociliatus]|uniref:DgyrCDS3259 n=1 Tax=Dimorphilus gyrociliatus TaxID=2664684 RepID=A0A7I8VD44_9ANNE|nr:DgyrCDS3259 [Dimorphilus gyrociliatus]